MKDFEIRYGDTMIFYLRMVSNAVFERTANRLECMLLVLLHILERHHVISTLDIANT